MQVTLIKTEAGWTKSLTSLNKLADAYRVAMHSMAVSSLHQGEQKNHNWANDLAKHLAGKRTFSQAKFVDWVHTYSPLRYDFKAKQFNYSPTAKNGWDLAAAEADPFFDTEKDNPSKKLKTVDQATRNYAQQLARRILSDTTNDTADDYAEYPAHIQAAITAECLKPATMKWVTEFDAQNVDNVA